MRSTYYYSLQHRKARGQGGSNGPENLVTACGSATTGCHGIMEARDPEMQARGLVVPSWNDPAETMVVLWTGIGVFLTRDGKYSEHYLTE